MNNKEYEVSRAKRSKKRKKNNLRLFILLGAGVLLTVIFLSFIFSPSPVQEVSEEDKVGDTQSEDLETENEETFNDDDANYEDEIVDESHSDQQTPDMDDELDQDRGSVKIESVESDDENVVEAFTANWGPVRTEQTGEHILNFNKNSQDRTEMEQAASLATELDQEQMTTWWLENKGDGQVEATVSDNNETEVYRVQLQWIDGAGWQPTQVAVLKENDQKWRFQ